MVEHISSSDGARIAVDRIGDGPAEAIRGFAVEAMSGTR
jgi:hypothetical protein